MKTYLGQRDSHGQRVLVANVRGVKGSLEPRHDVRSHSPTGYEWGYHGSGPAQLALALLCDHFGRGGEERALGLYQEFKAHVNGSLPYAGWKLTTDEIDAHIRRIEQTRRIAARL